MVPQTVASVARGEKIWKHRTYRYNISVNNNKCIGSVTSQNEENQQTKGRNDVALRVKPFIRRTVVGRNGRQPVFNRSR